MKLITLEGIDGSGKTSQQLLIKEWLEGMGWQVVLGKEPTNDYRRKIRKYADEGKLTPILELELFMEDRKKDVEENIIPALEEGKICIWDRYYHSTMAYQGARGFDKWLILEDNEKFAPRPILTILLDILPTEGFFRIAKRDEGVVKHFENIEFLSKVWKEYLEMCKELKYMKKVDAWRNEDEVFKQCMKYIEEIL